MVLDAGVPPEELAGVRSIATGAAPLEASVQRTFEARYKIPVLQSYGATEFGGPVTSMTLELHAEWGERKFGSVGRPLAGARLRVVDADTGATLPPGREGILEVFVPRMGPDWLRTSDFGVIDDDGFLFHKGRADGAIIRGGFKLLPETIERALVEHPCVSGALVVGLPDVRLGQVPAALVAIRRGASRPTPADSSSTCATGSMQPMSPWLGTSSTTFPGRRRSKPTAPPRNAHSNEMREAISRLQ